MLSSLSSRSGARSIVLASLARRHMGVLAPLLGSATQQNVLTEQFSGTPERIPMDIPSPTLHRGTTANGISVVSEDTRSPLTTLTVRIGVGTRDTDLSSQGAALTLKHALGASTENRSKLRVQRELDEIGASVSADITREHITIRAAAQAQYFQPLADIVGDAVSNLALKDYELRDILPHVQNDVTDSGSAALADAIHAAAYYDSETLGLPIYGGLSGASRDNVADLARRAFVGSNISVVTTGTDHDQAHQGISDRFAEVQEGSFGRAASEYVGGEQRVQRAGARTEVAVALNLANPAVAAVLATVLGSASVRSRHSIGGVAGGRAQAIVQADDSLVAVSGFAHSHSDGGLVGVSATTSAPSESTFATIANALKAGNITDDEVARAKAVLAGAAAASSSSQSGRADAILAASTAGSATAEAIAAVTTADVTSALDAALKSPASFATVGDVTNVPRYNVLSKLL